MGELFQNYAVGKSRRSIAQLMDIRPDSARVLRDGESTVVDPEEVLPGEVIEVHPGEKIPLDGLVLEGISSLDTAALTGESAPRDAAPGCEVLSGCVNLTGVLRLQVTKEYGQSTVAKILDLVENAAAKKARSEQFITRFARWYTPCVVLSAAALALIPPLFLGGWGDRSFFRNSTKTLFLFSNVLSPASSQSSRPNPESIISTARSLTSSVRIPCFHMKSARE